MNLIRENIREIQYIYIPKVIATNNQFKIPL
jgi:hypothetical protein